MKLKLRLIKETPQARLYELQRPGGASQQWVPRSVCPHTLKAGDQHEVTIEDWWLRQNPFQNKPQGQDELI